jgi:mono/diheme cytochrome c family protein
MRPAALAALLFLAAAQTAAAAPARPDPGVLEHGRQVFDKWCAPCHAVGPGHPGTQALDVKYKGAQPGALADRRDLTPDQVRFFVRHGVSIMPFFRKTEITDADLDALAAWLGKAAPKGRR